ncbi:MAG: hypothetical protein OJJ54_24310 [Pseudonocardia sp.]|nr:hypothetical protein [Pseudonocardia sp.]
MSNDADDRATGTSVPHLPEGAIPTQRTATSDGVTACRCGHGSDAHEHFRAGSDCAVCDCARYHSTTGLATQLSLVLRRGR